MCIKEDNLFMDGRYPPIPWSKFESLSIGIRPTGPVHGNPPQKAISIHVWPCMEASKRDVLDSVYEKLDFLLKIRIWGMAFTISSKSYPMSPTIWYMIIVRFRSVMKKVQKVLICTSTHAKMIPKSSEWVGWFIKSADVSEFFRTVGLLIVFQSW
jgi:hypothetical protein